MENKVTVIGYTGSGKTTYLIGMYQCMSGAGCKHYTLGVIDPNQDLLLDQMWENLCDGKYPDASFNSEKFSFHIAHDYKPVCDFDWLDYPGGVLGDPKNPDYNPLQESIRSSDCLLLVLDGDIFAIDAADEESYASKLAKKLQYGKSVKKELNQFNNLSKKGISIPPVCVMITKCDKIDMGYKDVIEKVLKENLASLFSGTKELIITAVSLGEDIENDGPDPFCVEEPIAFAVMMILKKYMELLKMKKSGLLDDLNKPRGAISRWWNKDELQSEKAELEKLTDAGNKWVADAMKLIELFDSGKDIYISGTKTNFRTYMRDIFSKINS